jgi:hypothetical protein
MKKKFNLFFIAAISMICLSCTSNRYQGTPYEDAEYKGGMQRIPGKVYCAYYDLGGEGIAWHDETPENHGSGALNPLDGSYLHGFRVDEGVDISYTKSNGIDDSEFNFVEPPMNLLYVGWTVPGEWTKYTVYVEETGKYDVQLLYTSNRGGKIALAVNDVDIISDAVITSTYRDDDPTDWRQWHHWNIAPLGEVTLKKGKQILTLRTVEEGQMNYAWLEFSRK